MRVNDIFCSYLFFALLVFNALALLSSEFSQTFSQIFILLTHNGRIYNILSLVFILCAILCACFNILYFLQKSNKSVFDTPSLNFILILSIAVLVVIVFLFLSLWRDFFNYDLDLMQKNTKILNDNEISQSAYFMSLDFFITLVCALFLCVLPLIYSILSLSLSIENPYAKAFLILKPNLNTAIFILAALSCQPYFLNTANNYVNFALLLMGLVLLLRLLFINNKAFRFYEYANMIFLSFIILCFIACSASMLRSDFFNAQNTLFTLAIFSWCKEWSANIESLKRIL